jgi:hypothetical protein
MGPGLRLAFAGTTVNILGTPVRLRRSYQRSPDAAFPCISRWLDVMDVQLTKRSSTAATSAPMRGDDDRIIETSIPSRLDALSWSGFHTRVVLALGITWILDGLEVTLAGALSGALKESPTLNFSNFDIGLSNSAYLAGAVLGALGFGWLTDRIGRRKLFFITLALYLSATAATALSWNVASYALFRFLTGAGIGGEYTAINSTIQELVPARYRGWTDLSRPCGVRDADVDPRKPALVDDPRSSRRSPRDRRGDRTIGDRPCAGPASAGFPKNQIENA